MSDFVQVPVLVISCDKYADLWGPFFTLFFRHWSDCPFPVFLGSNRKTLSDSRVKMLCIGDDSGWARSLARMLDQLNSEYVMLFLEDFLLERPVVTKDVLRAIDMITSRSAGCLRLAPHPPPTRALPEAPGFGVLEPGDDYRVSTQVAIWRVQTIRRLLHPEFSAWDFELKGSPLSDGMPDEFLSVYQTVFHYRHGVERGKWLPQGLKICGAAGVPVDMQARPAMTSQELWARRWSTIKCRIGDLFPRPIRRRLWPRPAPPEL